MEKDIPCQRYVEKGESLLCSEPVNFQTEWRAFVRYRIIWDVRSYRGNWHAHYGSNVLDNTIRAYTGTPAGYAMDFGLTEDGRTLLVEINDSFALGSYGLDPIQYAKLLSACWAELTGIHDECAVYYKGADWRKEKLRHSNQL